ncbi:MAG TPA: mechanosensitive ion channel family protein, partial [Stellaceae bacterium]|nr:mechanosensitive ion channel family protein [Stellaceae bacterium]
IVNATVENMAARTMFRQNLTVQVTYDTSAEQMQAFCRGIEQIFEETETVNKTNYFVRFNDFGESSLNIMVIFNLIVANRQAELLEREAILLKIMELAKQLGVDFAFPTRTLYVENPAALNIISGPPLRSEAAG